MFRARGRQADIQKRVYFVTGIYYNGAQQIDKTWLF